ncbi:MAG: phenylacetate--CoA ligase family protein [Methylotenera sp.]|nr:phenylacetate--CoA ligase family protein [Methylotenera sp.]
MIIRSNTSGNAWPTIASHNDAILLGLQYQLEQSQWLTPEQIQQSQLKQARQLLTHALTTVPYYKDSLSLLSIDSIPDLDWTAWQRIPILVRKDVQENSQNLISKTIPQDHLPVGAGLTSGSTGRPISLLRTRVTSQMWDAFTLRSHLWYGRDLSKKRAAIRYFEGDIAAAPLGAMQQGWGTAADMFLPHGTVIALNVSTPIVEQAKWLLKENPEYLISYPSNLAALAEFCSKEQIQFSNLKEIATMGELLSIEQRNACREAFGLEIIDTYSAEEVGYIAMQCPSSQHYHVQSENVLLEVVDEAGKPCKTGEVGRVVLTTLHNFAKPLIRYAIGDYAEVGAPCQCGRGLTVLKKVVGRSRNMFIRPDGQKFWPSVPRFTDEMYAALPATRQTQYVQKALDWIEVRAVVEQSYSSELEAKITTFFQKQFEYPYRMTFTYHHSLVNVNNGKFEEFLSELS